CQPTSVGLAAAATWQRVAQEADSAPLRGYSNSSQVRSGSQRIYAGRTGAPSHQVPHTAKFLRDVLEPGRLHGRQIAALRLKIFGTAIVFHIRDDSRCGSARKGRRRLSHVRVAVLALTPTDLTVDSLKASALFNLIAPPLHMAGLGVVLP